MSMILKNRLFDRQPPSEEAKSIFIFCEGARREQQYFEYFREIDSRVKIEVHPLDSSDNNSPHGLLRIAQQAMEKDYDFREGDEVWIVVDVDPDKANSRLPQFEQILQELYRFRKGLGFAKPFHASIYSTRSGLESQTTSLSVKR